MLITDEDDPGSGDPGSPGDPASWFQEIVTVKGTANNVVTLSLTRGSPGNVFGQAQGTELDGVRIMQFAQMFDQNGLVGDICAPSFGPFFDQAVGLIDSACDGFRPPG